MNKWKGWLALDLSFCIYFDREILFLLGKSQGVLNRDVYGNDVYYYMALSHKVWELLNS